MAGSPTVVRTHDPCPWLPVGGRAEVVLDGGPPPDPVSVVRLLATCADGVLVVPRPDGRGFDLPSAPAHGNAASVLDHLVDTHLAQPAFGPTPLGYVRNVVPDPPADYPWPAPVAHFTVWHVEVLPASARHGEWLGWPDAAADLGERHWWPLAAYRPPSVLRGGP